MDNDLIEGVILLPENLFYNTTAPGVIVVLARGKPAARKEQILLVNASAHFRKEKPKNVLTAEGIGAVAEVFRRWESRPKLSRIVTLAEVQAADYNLSPSQFVDINDRTKHRALAEIMADLQAAKVEREKADAKLTTVLADLKLIKE